MNFKEANERKPTCRYALPVVLKQQYPTRFVVFDECGNEKEDPNGNGTPDLRENATIICKAIKFDENEEPGLCFVITGNMCPFNIKI